MASLHDPAAPEHGDLVAHRQGFRLVVGHEQAVAPTAASAVATAWRVSDPQGGIQGGERLVEQHQSGGGRQGAGQGDALLLAARQFLRRPVGIEERQPHQLEQLLDPVSRPALPARQAEDDVVGDREMGKQRALLGDIADMAPLRRDMDARGPETISPPMRDRSLIGALEAAEQPQQRRLAAARGAQDRRPGVPDSTARSTPRSTAVEPNDFATCSTPTAACSSPAR